MKWMKIMKRKTHKEVTVNLREIVWKKKYEIRARIYVNAQAAKKSGKSLYTWFSKSNLPNPTVCAHMRGWYLMNKEVPVKSVCYWVKVGSNTLIFSLLWQKITQVRDHSGAVWLTGRFSLFHTHRFKLTP
jgi:hypothetical protein